MGCSASTSAQPAKDCTPPTVTASLNSNHNNNNNNYHHNFTTPIKVTIPSASPVHLTQESESALQEVVSEFDQPHIFYGGDGMTSDESLGEFILNNLRREADKGGIAQIDADSGVEWSFLDLLAHSIRIAKALEDLGLGPGDPVAFFSRNYHELFAGVLGTLMSGCTCVGMAPTNTVPELTHQIRLVKPRILMTEPMLLEVAKGAVANCPLPVVIISLLSSPDVPEDVQTLDAFAGSGAEMETDLASYKAVQIPNPKEHVGFILYSSGTTGMPKGVMVLSDGLVQFTLNCRNFAKDPGEIFLTISPLSWISAVWILLYSIYLGLVRTFVPALTETKLVRTLASRKIDRMISAPPVLMAMCANPNIPDGFLSSVVCLVGGSVLTAEMYHAIENRLGCLMLNAYGATEAGLICLSDYENPRPGKVGPILPNMRVKFVDLDTEEDITEPNVPGEVRIKAPSVMKGYVGNPTATAEAFDKNGWLKTGDLAYFEEPGFFCFVDRLKEMIKYRSHQVSPTEVENILLSHPSVKEACVIGRPHDVDGELPTAFISLASGAEVDLAELHQMVRDKLSDAKTLRGGIFILDVIPRTPTGKLLRKELRANLDKYPIPDENNP